MRSMVVRSPSRVTARTFKWVIVTLLLVEAHFAASYLVPLDAPSQRAFSGLLRWAWPWADGDHGPLGAVTSTSGFPLWGFFIAVAAAGLFVLAALAVIRWWVPTVWWRGLSAGAALCRSS